MSARTPAWEQRFRAPTLRFPTWSRRAPDRVVVLSNEEGSDQAYAWDPRGGGRTRITDEAVGVIYASASGDGARVVWFHDETGDESGLWVSLPFDGGGGEPQPVLPGAPSGWPDGIALGHRIVAAVLADRTGFALHVSEDGGPAKEVHRDVDRLTIGWSDYAREGFDRTGLSADETLLCLMVPQDGDNIHHGLRVLDPRTGSVVGELFDGLPFGLYACSWSPVEGDQRLAIAHEKHDLHRPAIWDLATGERTDISLDLPGEVLPLDWWPDASALLLVHSHLGREALLRYDLASGGVTPIDHEPGEIHGAGVRPDGRVWFRLSSGHRESRLLDDTGREILEAGGERAPVGRRYESFTFTNPNGDQIHGFYVLPEGEGPFPTYMKVHGGPSWLYLDTWMPEIQAFVDHGFAVGVVNYRGSTGYGRAHRDFIVGNVGFPEVEDTVAGFHELVRRGIADPERGAIGGWSWGGYTTLLAIGLHPDTFKAAIGGVPVGDYANSYDESAPSLQAYDRSLLGGTVYELPDLVRERSPITYADRVKTPTLVMVGEYDTRCPPQQALNWVEAARAAGAEVEVYTFGTGHVSYVVDEEIQQVRVKLDFLRRELLGE